MAGAVLREDQLRSSLAALFRNPELRFSDETAENLLAMEMTSGNLTVPCGNGLSVVMERFPVLADLRRGRRSTLVKILEDREDETILVADSILSGGKALFFARLLRGPEEVRHWIGRQQWPLVHSIIQPIDHEKVLIVSTVESFVIRSSEIEG